MLKQAGVTEEARCEFIGHEHDSINSTVYAGRLNSARLATLVFPALTFSLDYSQLRYRRGRFDTVIRAELARRERGRAHRRSADARAQPLQGAARET